MPRTCIVLFPDTEVTKRNGYYHLQRPDVPGAIIEFSRIEAVMSRIANPRLTVFRLPEGYIFGPDLPGRDREVSNFMLRSYMYFGRAGDPKTIFFIPKLYVLYIDYE